MSKRFVGKTGKASSSGEKISRARRTNEVPAWIRENEQLQELIRECLPTTYNFELQKTIHQVLQNEVSILGLQIPEGLLQFSLILSDIIRKFCPACHQVIVLGDVTYGACCVDDFTAKALGCQMLVHYGHSCLIPVDQTSIKTLYVFVEIGIDRTHLADTIRANFPGCMQELEGRPREQARGIKHLSIEHEQGDDRSASEIHLAVVGTVQFVSAVQALKDELEEHPSAPPIDPPKSITLPTPDPTEESAIQPHIPRPKCRFKVTVPQVKPLSPGEILGCTAPRLSPDIDAILYLGDGRFHLESIMIANPTIAAFRYDPYEKKITHEGYDHEKMRAVRASAIRIAQESLSSGAGRSAEEGEKAVGDEQACESSGRAWAVVLGTLGRQGSLSVLKSITRGLETKAAGTTAVPILISELSAAKLGLVSAWIDVCVQTSCPRLSIDWGHDFLLARADSDSDAAPPRVVPLLNPYEAKVALGQAAPFQLLLNAPSDTQSTALDTYPMDFYADQSLGDWTPRHGRNVRPVRQPAGAAA